MILIIGNVITVNRSTASANAPITNKMKAIKRNLPFSLISSFSLLIDCLAIKIPLINIIIIIETK